MSDTRLLLIRHGLIKANRAGRWHGSTDSPLTWYGKRQARYLAKKLTARPLTALYTSPLVRCRATAALISKHTDLDVLIDEDLREWSLGEWEDVPFADLSANHDFFRRTRTDPEFLPPCGESAAQVAERFVAALERIASSHEGLVAVVAHGAAMAVAVAALVDADPRQWTNYAFANCSISELVLVPKPYLNTYNEI